MKNSTLCGIDEAGRGPLAGDLVMAGCVLHLKGTSHVSVEGLNDSKKLTPKKREELYEKIIENSTYHIVKFSALQIDEMGISKCLKAGLEEIMQNIKASNYLFDGNTNFGVKGLETLIKADETIPEVMRLLRILLAYRRLLTLIIWRMRQRDCP